MHRFFRRVFALLLAAILPAVFLCACASSPDLSGLAQAPAAETTAGHSQSGAEIALITTDETLQTTAGQGVWNTISRFSGESGLSAASYKTEPGDPDAVLATLELAVTGGASLVVTMDTEVTSAISRSATRYGDISFVLLDAEDGLAPKPNTTVVRSSAQQAGWLAGYVAMHTGYGNEPIGVAEAEDETSRLYTMGYLLGADAAAEELGAEPQGAMVLHYSYTPEEESATGDGSTASTPEDSAGSSSDTPANSLAFNSSSTPDEDGPGTPLSGGEMYRPTLQDLFSEAGIVFASSSSLLQPSTEAASATDGTLIGIGMAPDELDATAPITLAFDAKNPVYKVLGQWRDGAFPGGKETLGSVADGDIQLAMDERYVENSTLTRYKTALRLFEDGTLAATINAAVQEYAAAHTLEELAPAVEYLRLLTPGLPPDYLAPPPDAGNGASLPDSSLQTSEAA